MKNKFEWGISLRIQAIIPPPFVPFCIHCFLSIASNKISIYYNKLKFEDTLKLIQYSDTYYFIWYKKNFEMLQSSLCTVPNTKKIVFRHFSVLVNHIFLSGKSPVAGMFHYFFSLNKSFHNLCFYHFNLPAYVELQYKIPYILILLSCILQGNYKKWTRPDIYAKILR